MHYIVGSDGSTASRARETGGRTEDAQGTESLTEEATGTTETGAIYRENTLDSSYPHIQFTYMYMYTFCLNVECVCVYAASQLHEYVANNDSYVKCVFGTSDRGFGVQTEKSAGSEE